MFSDSSDEEEDPSPHPAIRIPLGHSPILFSLPGSRDFARCMLNHLGWPLGRANFQIFDNSEISVKIDQNVTNHDVFVVCARNDSQSEMNFSLMQLFLCISALRGESPHRLTVVQPCLDYSRQDRRLVSGEAIPPRLLLRCMKSAGADRFLTVDLHNEAEAAFSPPNSVLDELPACKYLANLIRTTVTNFDAEKCLVCATNGGGMSFTRRMAAELCTGFIMADRVRDKAGCKGDVEIISSKRAGEREAIVIVDDIFDTCGTVVSVCKALHAFAPKAKIYGVATHGYFSGEAHLRMKDLVENHSLQWLAVTNSVDQTASLKRFKEVGLEGRLLVVDVSKLLAGAVMRIHLGASVNVPKFRDIGPSDIDPVLQTLASPRLSLKRHHTGDFKSPRMSGRSPQPPITPLVL